LIGAAVILAERKALGLRPLPCVRTIERVVERNGLTAPRVRLAPLLPRQEYPGPQARASNQLHEVDLVGPIYLQGSGHRYYIWIGKDAVDGAVCLRLAYSRSMDEVLWFLGECWKDLGRPEQVQIDNAREVAGWGPSARTLSRVIRLCLRFGVGPVFIPAGEPQFKGYASSCTSFASFEAIWEDRRGSVRLTPCRLLGRQAPGGSYKYCFLSLYRWAWSRPLSRQALTVEGATPSSWATSSRVSSPA
jgi:hypothetical protein